VYTTAALLAAIIETSSSDFHFKDPPYEYEKIKMPFDILAGSNELRTFLENKEPISQLRETWKRSQAQFESEFAQIAHYPED
jgi:uncharacterized protein YbbC (DUF1343 family)